MNRPRVERLPEHVANQIAAGEVVARPASVVKELVENALDAGARTIVVSLEGGGVGLVRVVDDGVGMDRTDARAALERHATSKLRSATDLQTLATLGFRGEALPSIASVSRFTLRTRTAEDDEGTELVTDANGAAMVRPCGAAVGTAIEVRDLFFNVPARRKFLRSLATESAHVADALRDTALAHPDVQFELWRDGRLHRRWLRAASLGARAKELFGEDVSLVVEEQRGPLHLEAHLSSPARVRSGATGLTLLVNRRPIQDRAVARAVATAYGERIERGKYPLGVVSLTLPTDACDVNVHPQKAEVRFAEPRAVCDAVFGAVQRAVEQREPTVQREPATDARTLSRPRWTTSDRASASQDEGGWSWVHARANTREAVATEPAPAIVAEVDSPRHRAEDLAPPWVPQTGPNHPLGEPPRRSSLDIRHITNLERALLACDRRGVYFVERRGACARILSIRARSEFAAGRLASQPVIFPIRLDVQEATATAVEAAQPALERLGIELRTAGPRSIALHSVPRVFADSPAGALAELVLETLSSLATPAGALTFLERASKLAARARPGSEQDLLEDWRRSIGNDEDLRDLPEVLHFVAASVYRSDDGAR
ncbi:MAG: DNA mismatch repair endonuclease MutL [Deltaproteobacteria bacterium]|nr:DNA mismatch repair endonuclease MutL [Deltaproteobacteria bacterium]